MRKFPIQFSQTMRETICSAFQVRKKEISSQSEDSVAPV